MILTVFAFRLIIISINIFIWSAYYWLYKYFCWKSLASSVNPYFITSEMKLYEPTSGILPIFQKSFR